ncbi:MAG: hypothetical protein JO349_00445 [Candidatus Eremiobacteraeota bacterium]|nr:hypothetical protein [Candidatus Eremiobacteraeota bacterium]
MNNENESVADQMNRGLFLAPDLIGEDEDDPLLEQAEANVEETVEEAEERKERES